MYLFKVVLINIILLSLFSCKQQIRYDINWTTFDTLIDFHVDFTFQRYINSRWVFNDYIIYPNITEYFYVPNDSIFSGAGRPYGINMYVHPDPYMLPNGGNLEIFLFNPVTEKISDYEFKMTSPVQNNIEAYFIRFHKDGKRYYCISLDELFIIDNLIEPPDDLIYVLENLINGDVYFF